MKRPFHLMAKPTSYQCNLACSYCFYLEKEQGTLKPPHAQRHMHDDVLRHYVQQYIAASPGHEVDFTWQGGEPTMAGLAFYRKAMAYQRQYANGKTIRNSMQTNGVLLDEAWAEFLAENEFLVGLSIDGPARLHDKYRTTHSGGSVFDKVLAALDRLRKHRIAVNLLTVVNDETAQAPLEIYRFLTQELHGEYLQFIPAVEQRAKNVDFGELIYPQTLDDTQVTPWSVSGEAYGAFMNAIFDYWVRHDVGRVYVQLFDNALAAWSGDKPSLCVMQPTCGLGLVVEQNGDIYSCDHFVYPEHRLGNITTDRLDKLVYSKRQRQFGMNKAQLPPSCIRCQYRFACHGGCPKHRIHRVDNHWHNHLCAGYKAIFGHIDPYMRYMADLLTRRQPPARVMDVAAFIAAEQSSRATDNR
ncbi:anaerobic sulfatase maturase [Martelella alba]|uniref:Anaerobic sulfatase maturase n=1 Tax=Martelella alba TaxID=2590451 RepID=A0ABY2SFY2_9HYPH|nr:anaerobic sulfatase maturase [Martelella alba]TKI03955.1 anaerobic sulfatase maturase [Martelella alba]